MSIRRILAALLSRKQRPKVRPVSPEVANDPAYWPALRTIDKIRPE